MTSEGDLVVRLAWDGRHVRRVAVRSTRPLAASRLLVGKPLWEAVATVPLVFNVCGAAQAIAAAAAADAACGRAPQRAECTAREVSAKAEAVQEYLWRILIDWPLIARQLPQTEAVAEGRRAVARFRDCVDDRAALATALGKVAADRVLGVEPCEWLKMRDLEALHEWTRSAGTQAAALLRALLAEAPRLGTSDVALMPAATPDALAAAVVPGFLGEADFPAAPHWAGEHVETGALARMQSRPLVAAAINAWGRGVVARMIARLAELAELLAALAEDDGASAWHDSIVLARNAGLAWTETARGLLIHRIRVTDGRVAEYQIVAPTEWNFHPRGPLAVGLMNTEAATAEDLERQARLTVQSLDPCVPCRVEIGHA